MTLPDHLEGTPEEREAFRAFVKARDAYDMYVSDMTRTTENMKRKAEELSRVYIEARNYFAEVSARVELSMPTAGPSLPGTPADLSSELNPKGGRREASTLPSRCDRCGADRSHWYEPFAEFDGGYSCEVLLPALRHSQEER